MYMRMVVFALSFVRQELTTGWERAEEGQALTTNRKQTEGESEGDTLSGTADTMRERS